MTTPDVREALRELVEAQDAGKNLQQGQAGAWYERINVAWVNARAALAKSAEPQEHTQGGANRDVSAGQSLDRDSSSEQVTRAGNAGSVAGGAPISDAPMPPLPNPAVFDPQEAAALRKENDTLRGLLGNSAKPCTYCGLAAEDQGKCPDGFPGCMRADDQMLSQHFADGWRAEQAEKELRVAEQEIAALNLKLKIAEKETAALREEVDRLKKAAREDKK